MNNTKTKILSFDRIFVFGCGRRIPLRAPVRNINSNGARIKTRLFSLCCSTTLAHSLYHPLRMRSCSVPSVRVRILNTTTKKAPTKVDAFFMAAGEGFEPSQNESESLVLPLHHPATSF